MGHLAQDVAGPVPALVVDIDKDDEDDMQDTGINKANEDHREPALEDWNEEDKSKDKGEGEDEDEESESGASDNEGCETDKDKDME